MDAERRKLLALIATQNSALDLRSAGYSALDLRFAGYSASDVLSAGYSASDVLFVGYSASDVRSAGYSASDLRSAGYSASDLRSAGYSASDLLSAGYSALDVRSAGYSASDVLSAGYSASDVLSAGYSEDDLKEWDSIPVIPNLYSSILADIKSGQRLHKQSTWGPDCDPTTNLCKTPMCTAGHLVNRAGAVGYALLKKYGGKQAFPQVAAWIHAKSRPDVAPQNFGSIPQEWALAYIEERAEEESRL